METTAIRLQKYMADCGVASRRKCEEMIDAGRVTVNGKVAELGSKVVPGKDKVVLDGKKVITNAQEQKVYLMLNKPKGYIAAVTDDRGRQTVIDLLSDVPQRVYPVGRLDYNTEGLLLLTNDGAFANAMTHPKYMVEKGYEVTVSGKVTDAQMARLQEPFELDGYRTHGAKAMVLEAKENKTVIYIGIGEGRNRQVRRMCEQTGLLVRKLKRISVGDLHLGDLPLGRYRYLKKAEIQKLLAQKKEEQD